MPMKSTTDPGRAWRTIFSGGLHLAALELPATLNSHPLKLRCYNSLLDPPRGKIMIISLQKLFNEFDGANIKYFLYKSLEHLGDDLDAKRGDIDLFVTQDTFESAKDILLENGFIQVINRKHETYFIKEEGENNKFIIIDIQTAMRLGKKPFRSLNINYNELWPIENDTYGIPVLRYDYYAAVTFLIRTSSESRKKADLNAMALSMCKINEPLNYFFPDIIFEPKVINLFDLIKYSRISSDDLDALQGGVREISTSVRISLLKFIGIWNVFATLAIKSFWWFLHGVGRKLGSPAYRIRRKGHFVVIMGVDGAGKSSAIDFLLGNNFLKLTGIKNIYFGNNNFWMPGLPFLAKNARRFILAKMIFYVLSRLDRQLRVIPALYYKYRGFLVIGDRYFYDDEILIGGNACKKHGNLVNFLKALIRPRAFIDPDMIIYLKVSSKIAYTRKKDYTYEILCDTIKLYDHFFNARNSVNIINADRQNEIVKGEIFSIINSIDMFGCRAGHILNRDI
jgi:thymidylate kinase